MRISDAQSRRLESSSSGFVTLTVLYWYAGYLFGDVGNIYICSDRCGRVLYRLKTSHGWTIIDRSSEWARTVFIPDDVEEHDDDI